MMKKVSGFVSMKKLILSAVGILFMFCGGLPPMFGLSELGMQVAGIFIGTVLLWLFVSVSWPSVLCIVSLPEQAG